MKKRNILILIILLAIGFASASTTLYLNGTANIGVNRSDYDVYFSKVIENERENNSLIVDKTHIKFNGNLTNIGDIYKLRYTVKNGSKNYDASVTMNCTGGNEYINVENTFNTTKELVAGESRDGVLTIKVIKSSTEEITANIVCEITAGAVERTELGEEESISRTVYGVRRSIDSSNTAWERIESSVGLTANATKDGSEVENDFDSIYPWSDIITYNYDDVTKTETAKYGEENFKFDGSNGQVLTRIPSFYYKRTVLEGYEYIYISEEEQPGYTQSEAFSVGRYTMSGNSTKVYSKSGVSPLVNKTITDFRNYARNLGNDFGQLDWRYFLIQMLYLVEYADYNSQEVLGLGNTNSSGAIASGECNSLGMKSGSIINDGKHSVIYRGMEDIFGNVWQFIDGINIKDNQAYINYNPGTYAVDKFDGDYQKLGYINSGSNGYIKQIGYDENHPLISLPTLVGEDDQSYISDYYLQDSGNRIALVGGDRDITSKGGLWYWVFTASSSRAYTDIGARLLRTS